MKVRCLSNRGVSLPQGYADGVIGYDQDRIFALKVGKDYVVYALIVHLGDLWYYVLDERGVRYPTWYPAPLFEIIDRRLSRFWVIGTEARDTQPQYVVAFPDWAERPIAYYDELTDGDDDALRLFMEFKELLDVEFESPTDAAIEIDGEWLMCPLCHETWRATLSVATVKCPHCRSILQNPRLSVRQQ